MRHVVIANIVSISKTLQLLKFFNIFNNSYYYLVDKGCKLLLKLKKENKKIVCLTGDFDNFNINTALKYSKKYKIKLLRKNNQSETDLEFFLKNYFCKNKKKNIYVISDGDRLDLFLNAIQNMKEYNFKLIYGKSLFFIVKNNLKMNSIKNCFFSIIANFQNSYVTIINAKFETKNELLIKGNSWVSNEFFQNKKLEILTTKPILMCITLKNNKMFI